MPRILPHLPGPESDVKPESPASQEVDVIQYLSEQFQDENAEISALRSLGPNTAPAYRSYHQFLIFRTVSSALGLALDTRKVQDFVLCDDLVNVCLQDVYAWVGINQGTFLNKKTELANTSLILDCLQSSLEGGYTSHFGELYRMYWKHYLLSFKLWVAVPPSSWMELLGWKLKDMKV
ncbi:hypothetical protein PM082_022709 [Marasmius tenuissimus]|nr:hypothetical protein PM082_022709 [Marasmius tenuissimus]